LRYILTPVEAAACPHAGGKARALALAMRGGLPVPPWVVLAADAFETSAGAGGIAAGTVPDRLLRAIDGGEAPHLLDALDLAPEIVRELSTALEHLCADGAQVAVRSSASDEDGPEHSFAGQLESFLSVPAADVPARVRDVWRSGFTARIVAYRREHGLPPMPRPPAVLIQRMVRARVAGVAFSADPVSGRHGTAVISAVPGLGSALVSGEAEADTWLVNRDRTIVERRIPSKRLMHVADGTQPGGVAVKAVRDDRSGLPSLMDAEVLEIAALARRAARQFGRPQDIEWAYEDARLWLLQSRPITSMAAMADPDATLLVWDNSNIVESYSGVTTPLTFSFTSEIYEHVYREFCRLMGVSERRIAAHDDSFRNMLGLIRGRLYYNLLNWYRMLALLPGFAMNRRFMEQMMGVKETLPPDLANAITASARAGQLRDAAHVVRALTRITAAALTIERRVRRFQRRLDEALAPPDPPLEERRPEELVGHYRDLRSRLLLRWDAPIVNDFLAMIAYGLLRRLTVRWLADPGGTLQNDLIGGEGGMVSAEPAMRLQQLARAAAADSALLEQLLAEPPDDPAGAFAAWPRFSQDLRAYLERFGERTVNELKLESETLHDDPRPLLRAIASFARQLTGEAAQPRLSGGHLRAEARKRAERLLAAHPLRRRLFGRVVASAQARLRDRENLRLERTRLFGRVRRVFLELGRRFHALGLLDAPRDIFYLGIDEVLGFVEGRATTTNLRALVALRRAEFRSFADGPEPHERFETRGVVYHAHSFRRPAEPVVAGEGERQGLGCSPGIVVGPVRVVRDPNEVDLTTRAVLVAEHTDPGWILVFPTALGVLVERGSLLSHAAIVARELGIPAVVSIPGLTRWLRDGDWVEFDGTTGVIRRIDARAPALAHAQ
jgi:rifampicin phosphotransferase